MEIISNLTVNYEGKVLSLSDIPADISVKQFKRTLFYKLELPELDKTGKEIPGFTLDDCNPMIGDDINHTVTWKGGNLTKLAGKPVRLRFHLIRSRSVRVAVCSLRA